MDTNKNKKVLSILIGLLLVTLVAVGGLIVYTYSKEDSTKESDKNMEETENDEPNEETSEDLPTDSPNSPDGAEGDDPEVKSYISETFECLDVYRAPGKATPDGTLVVVYPDNPEIELKLSETTGAERCFMTVTYLTGELDIQYNVGEGFTSNLSEDFETIKTVGSILLVRDPLTYREATPDTDAYYTTTYGTKKLDGECTGGISGNLRPPCYSNNHPFMTYIGIVDVTIDDGTSEEDRAKIMEVFDDIAERSYSSRN